MDTRLITQLISNWEVIKIKTDFYDIDDNLVVGRLDGMFNSDDEVEFNGVKYRVLEGSAGSVSMFTNPLLTAKVAKTSTFSS